VDLMGEDIKTIFQSYLTEQNVENETPDFVTDLIVTLGGA